MSLICLSYTCLRAVTARCKHISLDVSTVTTLHVKWEKIVLFQVQATASHLCTQTHLHFLPWSCWHQPAGKQDMSLLSACFACAAAPASLGVVKACPGSMNRVARPWTHLSSCGRFVCPPHSGSTQDAVTQTHLYAFWVPTTLRQYTGCCNTDTSVCFLSAHHTQAVHRML